MIYIFVRLLAILAFLGVLPIVIIFSCLVFLTDLHSPFYVSERIGLNGRKFKFYKIRSMRIDADKLCVDSTKDDDDRITVWGKVIRRYKIDEFLQFLCVIKGDMVFVGPRANVEREVNLYTYEEQRLLTVYPGITSISSIVFSDLGSILQGSNDPDIAYNQLVRPWKNRLDLFYIENRSFLSDTFLVFATGVSIFSRKKALSLASYLLKKKGADATLIRIAKRDEKLQPSPPPGADEIVTCRV